MVKLAHWKKISKLIRFMALPLKKFQRKKEIL